MKVSIVIPNYNGLKLLNKNLPKVIDVSADEIVVTDDASTDDSVSFLKEKYPQVKVVTNRTHFGFPSNSNQGIRVASGDIIVMLNNDVVPEKNFLPPLLEHFKKDDVFSVGAAEPDASFATAQFKDGFFVHKPGKRVDKTHVSMWTSGGSSAFSKKKWLELGGFYEGFNPGYWEDIDLCFRAQKRGWQVLWEPKSVVYHKHETTFSAFYTRKQIDFISRRNQLMFIWKNITSPKLITSHQRALLGKMLTDPAIWRPFLAAIIKLPEIKKLHNKEGDEQRISDEEIFEKFKDD